VERASQTLLPGFGAPPIVISEELTEHPIVSQLVELDVDGMTPIQALMLLNQWKDMIKD
jgi:DNA mismatch repair protein MutS